MRGTSVGRALLFCALVGCAVLPGEARPFRVRTPEEPKAWERTAAGELADYLGQVADGGQLTVEGEDAVVFHVGDTGFARDHGLDASALQDEEWLIRSFGRDVVLVGGGTRGTLYAVYRFLEDDCGVRWWGDGEEDVPAAKPLAFGRLDRRGKPKFLYRDIYRADTSDPKTAVRNRVNGNGVSWIPPEFGGGFVFGPPYHCHTWDRYLPFEKYGKEHPEWYSLNKEGKRVGGQSSGQLCLACPGLPEILADRIEEYIAKGEKESAAKGLPAPRMYDMSMNDNDKYCACETCKASQARHGVSGDQLKFENKVAGILAKRHPDLLFSVFAYFAGEAVPSNGVRAADNVLVKLCNTKQNMAAGIFEPCNRFMRDQVANWKDYAKNLFVWDYSITFDRNTHGFPFASEFHLGERIRYYSDNGVVGMLIEHERPATNDFYELKYWVQAKALEDPSRDPEALVVEFMDGYYGAAGRKILELRRGLDRIRRERDAFITWFPRVSEWTFYTVEDLERAERLWDEAEALVRDDPKRLRRVRRSRIGTTRLKDLLVRLARCRHAPEPGVSDRPFVDCTPESGAYVPHDSRFTVVDDPAASTGKAVRMPVSAAPKHHSMPFQIGIYCPQEAKSYASKGWSKPLGEGYQWYDLGEVTMPEKPYYVYFTRSWLVQVAPGLSELQGVRCRVKARVRFTEDAIFIDRTAFIPAANRLNAGLVRRTVLAQDDYEDEAIPREGKPQIVKGILSPGMLEQTGQGRYVTTGVKQLRCTDVGLVSGDGMFAVQSLRLYAMDEGARLESAFVVGRLPGDHVVSAVAERRGETVNVTVTDDGRTVGSCSTSVSKFPADFEMAVSPSGEVRVALRSLVDSGVTETSGRSEFLLRYPNGFRAFWWMHAPKGTEKGVSLTVDELWTGLAQENREKAVPYAIDRLETFDPEKAGWRLVFEDEFDGEKVAWGDKWFQAYYNVCPRELVSLDGEGHAKIKVDYVKGTKDRLVSSGLYTRKAFGYGYYAARVKFTRQNGFWSAFWTYGDANSNPFLDGFEIDGYEDYYLREKDAAGKVVGDMLDHNLHVRGGLGRSKSWNYKTHLEGIDEWHVLGVRWTPFEISYYLDGKLMKSGVQVGHSPYDTVTFDAFHHAACTAPNHAVLSGCIMRATWNKRFQDLTGCTFPDYFTVDWVKVWEYPDPPESKPSVAWTAETSAADVFAPTGSVVKLSVDVAKASATGARIRGVYLFDSGFFLQCRTEPPFAFEIPLTEEFYSRTAYARPGRQREVFTLAKDVPHVFHVFVQDENGRVGRTELPLFRIPKRGESAPYEGVAQKLPGVLNPAKFDAGGVGVGYYKHPMTVEKVRKDLNPRPSYAFRGDEHVSCSASGDAIDFTMSSEWMNYTVEVASAGTYAVEFAYGAPGQGWNELQLYVDGRPAGRVALAPRKDALDVSFVRDALARTELALPGGRHVLTLLPVGPISFGPLKVSGTPGKITE